MNRSIIAAVDDMFFVAKIRATAESLGLKVDFVKSIEALSNLVEKEIPALIVADLHSQKCDPFALAEQIKADERLRRVPLIGFYSHVQIELQHRASRAGFDRIMPRSVFTKHLPDILQGNVSKPTPQSV